MTRDKKCIFLGISDYSKAYRLYNPNTKKIIISWFSMILNFEHGAMMVLNKLF
jgi:hypothetical protein